MKWDGGGVRGDERALLGRLTNPLLKTNTNSSAVILWAKLRELSPTKSAEWDFAYLENKTPAARILKKGIWREDLCLKREV